MINNHKLKSDISIKASGLLIDVLKINPAIPRLIISYKSIVSLCEIRG